MGKGLQSCLPCVKTQMQAKQVQKCFSIVCLSPFVCLTNEEYTDTGQQEKVKATKAAGAPGQLIFAQQLEQQTSYSPAKEKGQQSPHKWLCYRDINPELIPPTYLCPLSILLHLPTNPFRGGQFPGHISVTSDIAEVRLNIPV